MTRARVCGALAAAAVVAMSGCGDGNESARPSTTTVPATTIPAAPNPKASVPGAGGRAVVRGKASLDGVPFDAEFLGAVVRRDGLVTPCQYTLPQVNKGDYEIAVMGDAEASGCGVAGAEILLWTFVNEKQYFSTRSIQWPRDLRATTFDASFSTAAPNGAMRQRTEVAGEIFERDGRRLGPGTRVEAYIGNTLCGVASVRTHGDFTGISLSIVGPDSIAGCARGATVTFRVDGRKAVTTAANNFRPYRSLDLTLP
jgi:hypothetical protein